MPSTLRRSRLDLSWMKPPAMPEDGQMALLDHLRELRYRVIVAAVAIAIGTVVAWFFYPELYRVIMWPFNSARARLAVTRPDIDLNETLPGVAAPLMMQLQLSGFAGILGTCPIWLYQLWAFIAPGLLAREKKWAYAFLGASVPLFLSGVALGYFVTPKGYEVMIGFLPEGSHVLSLVDIRAFMINELKLLAIFGAAFLLPVIMVALNLAGVVTGLQMRSGRRLAIFCCFVFGAIATPSTDPFTMCALSAPMAILYVIAEFICVAHDKRKRTVGDDIVTLDY